VPPLLEHSAPAGEDPADLYLPVWNEQEQRYIKLSLTDLRSLVGPGITVDGRWRFDVGTTAADPGLNRFRLNHATFASVTAVYFSETTLDGFDAASLMGRLDVGHRFYIQQTDDATRSGLFEVSGAPTDNGAWWTVPVTVIDAGTLYISARICTALFLLTTAGTAGAGSLDDLSDVVIDSSLTTGDVLAFDGANWVNTPASASGGGYPPQLGYAGII
jgi:hypothetical protein